MPTLKRPLKTLISHQTLPTLVDLGGPPLDASASLPTQFAWTGLEWPLDQGQCGACWAFAAVSSLNDRYAIWSDLRLDLSPYKMLICNYGGLEYDINLDDFDEQTNAERQALAEFECRGNSLGDAWRYLFTNGVPELTCVTPEELGSVCNLTVGPREDQCPTGATMRTYRCSAYYSVPPPDIAREIHQRGPVSAAILVFPDFWKFDFETGVYDPDVSKTRTSQRPVGHAVRLVGWGESASEGAWWWVVNSFGSKWGSDGMFKLRRGHADANVVAGLPDAFGQWPLYASKADLRFRERTEKMYGLNPKTGQFFGGSSKGYWPVQPDYLANSSSGSSYVHDVPNTPHFWSKPDDARRGVTPTIDPPVHSSTAAHHGSLPSSIVQRHTTRHNPRHAQQAQRHDPPPISKSAAVRRPNKKKRRDGKWLAVVVACFALILFCTAVSNSKRRTVRR